jgi:hypothetical protein
MRLRTYRLAILAAGWLSGAAAAAGPLTSEQPTPHQWVVKSGSQTILVYTFAPEQFKPYVRELAPPGGGNILRDSPADHKHHHGLMYAVRVNGINFWEETPGAGIERPAGRATIEVREDDIAPPEAVLRHRIHWIAAEDAKRQDTEAAAILIEDRALSLSPHEEAGETALRWHAEFRVGPKAPEVTLSGSNYNGLGLRFLQALDPVATHVVGGRTLDLAGTRQDVAQASWGAVQFKGPAPAGPATVALFSSPRNACESRFFSMARPFAYLAATQGLDQKPLRYKSGDTFTLDYLVTVYPEVKPAQFLAAGAERWTDSINRQRP